MIIYSTLKIPCNMRISWLGKSISVNTSIKFNQREFSQLHMCNSMHKIVKDCVIEDPFYIYIYIHKVYQNREVRKSLRLHIARLCCISAVYVYSYSIQKRQSISIFLLLKSSNNIFYFFSCILPDYVAHESLKEVWKNIHFENMRAGFHLRCQNSLRFVTPEMMHFQPWKKNISTNIMS